MLNKKILLFGFVGSVIAIFGYRTWHTTQNRPTTLVVTPTLPSTTFLTGYWFTPHEMLSLNITFLDNHQFIFKTSDAVTPTLGIYTFDGSTVTLPLKNDELVLTLSTDETDTLYLTDRKAGVYFVKK